MVSDMENLIKITIFLQAVDSYMNMYVFDKVGENAA